jgi:hypothetical protein
MGKRERGCSQASPESRTRRIRWRERQRRTSREKAPDAPCEPPRTSGPASNNEWGGMEEPDQTPPSPPSPGVGTRELARSGRARGALSCRQARVTRTGPLERQSTWPDSEVAGTRNVDSSTRCPRNFRGRQEEDADPIWRRCHRCASNEVEHSRESGLLQTQLVPMLHAAKATRPGGIDQVGVNRQLRWPRPLGQPNLDHAPGREPAARRGAGLKAEPHKTEAQGGAQQDRVQGALLTRAGSSASVDPLAKRRKTGREPAASPGRRP